MHFFRGFLYDVDRPKDWNVFQTGKFQYAKSREFLGLSSSDLVLEEEVKKNGFLRVLTTKEGKSLSKIVNEKLKHPRHKALIKYAKETFGEDCELCYDEMLAGLSKMFHFFSKLDLLQKRFHTIFFFF